MTGSKGNDYYQLSSVADKISEQAGQGIDSVFSPLVSYTLEQTSRTLLGVTASTAPAMVWELIRQRLANKLKGAAGKDSSPELTQRYPRWRNRRRHAVGGPVSTA